jgi:hypothetical protein
MHRQYISQNSNLYIDGAALDSRKYLNRIWDYTKAGRRPPESDPMFMYDKSIYIQLVIEG